MSKYILSVFLIFSSTATFAADIFPRIRLGLFEQLYSGEKYYSFADSGQGFGLSLSLLSEGNKNLAGVFKIDVGYLSAKQSFMDGTTELKNTTFNNYSVFGNLGINLFPIERKSRGANLYISVMGLAGSSYLALSSTTQPTVISLTELAYAYGYSAGVGVEFFVSSVGSNKSAINVEAAYKTAWANFHKRNDFDLGGLIFSFGYQW